MNKAQVLLETLNKFNEYLLPSGTPGIEKKKRRVKEHEFGSAMKKQGKGVVQKKEPGGIVSYYAGNKRIGYTEKKRGKDKTFWTVETA